MDDETGPGEWGERPGELPRAAQLELIHALRLLRGGNALARAAAAVARVAGFAAAPLMRLGARAAGPGAGALQPLIEATLVRAFDIAVIGLAQTERSITPMRSRAAAALSGFLGGAAGLPGFLPDATFTTLLILRHIAAIARNEGEDPADEETRRACLEVFTFGGPVKRGADAEESEAGYWTARLLLQGSPIVKLITEAASRFGIALSEKLALQAVPLAGAAGGALVNTAFLDHYRAIAEGHFVIRRLERHYGADRVRGAAERSSGDETSA